MNQHLRLFAFAALLFCLHPQNLPAREVNASTPGIFQDSTDLGNPLHAGSVQFDPGQQTYLVTGGGSNMWFGRDAFQFVWKKMSGNVSLTADIRFVGKEGDPHRKACLMIRQALAPDSVYADAALHGNGLTALQYRDATGALTKEVHCPLTTTRRMRIEKHGDTISLYVAAPGQKLQPAGSIQLHLNAPFYVGLAVCAHDNKTVRQAVFSKVELKEGNIYTRR